MSYQQFGEGGAQPQAGSEEQGGFEHGGYGAPGGPPQQHQMGQQMDPQQQNVFPGQPGAPGSSEGPAGGDQKTTLW